MAYDGQSAPDLPHSLDAELSVIGGLLYWCAELGNNDYFDEMAEIVSAIDFYYPETETFFAAAASLNQRAIIISPQTILENINSTGVWTAKTKPNEIIANAFDFISKSEVKDFAGLVARQAERRRLILAGYAIVDHAQQPGHDKGTTAIYSRALEIVEEAQDAKRDTGLWLNARETVLQEIDNLEKVAAAGRPTGISTGISFLDNKIGGLHRGDLLVIGGASSMGKTATALNICLGAARTDDAVVALFSQEMTKEQLAWRAASSQARLSGMGKVEYQSLRNGAMGQNELAILRAGAQKLPEKLLWNMARGATFQDVRSAIRRAKRLHGRIDVVCIDYLQIMSIPSTREKTRAQAIADVTMGLKKLAGDENCAMILLSQLSRLRDDDKRPQLHHLRESGAIEQDADSVIFTYREDYYIERREPAFEMKEAWQTWNMELSQVRGRLDLIVAKQRMGPIGPVSVYFEKETDLIVDTEKMIFDEGDMF